MRSRQQLDGCGYGSGSGGASWLKLQQRECEQNVPGGSGSGSAFLVLVDGITTYVIWREYMILKRCYHATMYHSPNHYSSQTTDLAWAATRRSESRHQLAAFPCCCDRFRCTYLFGQSACTGRVTSPGNSRSLSSRGFMAVLFLGRPAP